MAGKALRLDLHPRVLQLAEILDRGDRTFEELHPRDKELLYQTTLDTSGLVDEKEMRRYELERRAELSDSKLRQIVARGRLRLDKRLNE